MTTQKINLYLLLTAGVAILATVAAAGGLFVPGLYRDNAALIPILQGQDGVTLLAAPVLLVATFIAWRGSTRALLMSIGILGYMMYTYTGAAFAYSFNELILVYIALFAMSVFAMAGLIMQLPVQQIRQTFDDRVPRKGIAGFLFLIALALGLGELAQILGFYATGELPVAMQQIEATSYFVFVLDLGLIVPLSLLAAVWLWRDNAWGYVLASTMLIKAATMGLALVVMTWFAAQAGIPDDGLLPLWAFIAVGGFVFSAWLLRHCHDETHTEPVIATSTA